MIKIPRYDECAISVSRFGRQERLKKVIKHRVVFVFGPVRMVNNGRDEGRKTFWEVASNSSESTSLSFQERLREFGGESAAILKYTRKPLCFTDKGSHLAR